MRSWSFAIVALPMMGSAATCSPSEVDTDFDGNDVQPLSGHKVADSGACCDLCASMAPACGFWTFMPDGTCYPKTSDAGRRSFHGYVSGKLPGATPAPTPAPPAPTPGPPTGWGCDPHGGERGVCVNKLGTYPDATCGGGGCAKPWPSPGFRCASDWDCSLSGVCDAGTGACECDAWASGSDCSYLAFQPLDRSSGRNGSSYGYVDAQHSSWGGDAVLGADGKWHLFMAEIACAAGEKDAEKDSTRCGLGGWSTHSQVAHAVADRPGGPYARAALVAAPEHHNPTLKVSPVDGSWNLYSIRATSGPIVVSTSLDQGASWSDTSPGKQVSAEQNPGPYLWRNGSMTMWYRAAGPTSTPCSDEIVGVQFCDNATAACADGRANAQAFRHTAEDPSVFRDVRGNYHMLVNALPGGCQPKALQGGHAWSKDGIAWSEPRVGAYNGTVQFTDGGNMTCGRRERPQMILDPKTGVPLAMTAGATGCPAFTTGDGVQYKGGGDCFTLVQMMEQ